MKLTGRSAYRQRSSIEPLYPRSGFVWLPVLFLSKSGSSLASPQGNAEPAEKFQPELVSEFFVGKGGFKPCLLIGFAMPVEPARKRDHIRCVLPKLRH